MQDILQLLRSHRSIRKYTDQPLSDELLREILDSSRQAPTSANLQAYSIIVVRDAEKKKTLARLCGNQPWVENCQVFLAMCPDLHRINEVCKLRGYNFKDRFIEILLVSVVDTALVAQNITVAAESSGLGICMIGGIRNNPKEVCDLLNLPDRVFPLMGICLGYPDQAPMIKPRLPSAAVVHYESYSDQGLPEILAEYDELIRSTGMYEAAHRKISSPDFQPVPDDQYSWSEHSARRVSTSDMKTLRAHMREFLLERKIGLE